MPILYVFEAISYYICLIIILNKILDGVLHKLSITLSFLIYIPILIIWRNMSEQLQCCVIFTIFIFEIAFLWITSKNVKLRSLVSSIIFLFCFNTTFNYLIVAIISISNNLQLIVEAVTHILMCVLCFVFCHTKISYKIKNIISWTPKNVKRIILVLGILGMLSIALMTNIQNYLSNDLIANLALKTIVVLIVLMVATFPIMILNAATNTYLKKLTHNYEEQIKAQAEHYSALAKANFELRRFRHDLKNIQIGVKEFISKGEFEKALDMLNYSENQSYQINDINTKFDTGNGIVDALLADKQKKAAPSNTEIVFEGAIPTDNITATELCVLFGNTVDNAIEACQKLNKENEKTINICCNCSSGFMFLNISNPIDKPIEIKNNTLMTTKTDKTLHGFGLYSLDKIIKTHNGQLNLSCENNNFNIDINMCIC